MPGLRDVPPTLHTPACRLQLACCLAHVIYSNPHTPACRLQLARCLDEEHAAALLDAELPCGREAHAALAFLATAVKDHGAVPTTVALLRCASARRFKF